MAVITKEIMGTAQETVAAEAWTGARELTEAELYQLAAGSRCYGGCKHAKPTGNVYVRWVIEGLVYHRDVELKCPVCGEISYRSKMF